MTTPRLVFGLSTVCPRCGKRDRRGHPYGRGWFWWLAHQPLPSYIMGTEVIEVQGDWVKIKCNTCNGLGVVIDPS